jgi:hypothetical protein
VKYLLDAADEEMADWKLAADREGASFAEWLRRAARDRLRESRPATVVETRVASRAGRAATAELGWSGPDFKAKVKR